MRISLTLGNARSCSEITDLVKRHHDGEYRPPEKITLGEYQERWLPTQKQPLAASTFSSYQRNIRLHALPNIGAIPIQRLTPEDLDNLCAELLSNGRRNKGGGTLEPKTVRLVHAVIHKALADARRKGSVARNVADLADPPKVSTRARPKMKVWNADELRGFLELIEGHDLHTVFYVKANTGMRRGARSHLAGHRLRQRPALGDPDSDRSRLPDGRKLRIETRRVSNGVTPSAGAIEPTPAPQSVAEAAEVRYVHLSGPRARIGHMHEEEVLRTIAELSQDSGRAHVHRSTIEDSLDLSTDDLSRTLEQLHQTGMIIGATVAEEVGPIAGIRLTAAGRRTLPRRQQASDPRTNPVGESYLGYDIESIPLAPTGSAARHAFRVSMNNDLQFILEFSVSYSAAIGGDSTEELARMWGTHLMHGMIHLQDYQPGASINSSRHSMAQSQPPSQISGERLESVLLKALQRMLRAEHRSSEIPALDVPGVAAALGVASDLISATLSEMAVRGLIEGRAETLGHPLADGACRITAAGLARVAGESSAVSPPGGRTRLEATSDDHPTAFISYSHDSAEHVEAVMDLASRLRVMGIQTEIDRYEQAPTDGWPRWMARMIDQADFVLVVCSESYYRRAMGHEEVGVGLGATYEGTLINQRIYEAGGANQKFLPVILDEGATRWIPDWLRPYTRYNVSTESQYESMYRVLTEQPSVVRPPMGEIVEMLPVNLASQSSTAASDPPWHVDLCFRWDIAGGPIRYLTSWAPETGFLAADDLEVTLGHTGGRPAPADLPIEQGIAVSFLPGQALHFEFNRPAQKVTAALHVGDSTYEPDERGGGARQYLTFKLHRLPELPG